MSDADPTPRKLWLAALAGWLLTVGAFFPGVMSPDSVNQLTEARAASYSLVQPGVMTILWGLLDHIVAGPALMLLGQAALWWGGWTMVIRRVLPGGVRQPIVLLAVGLWPPLFAMVGTIWRDVHMTVALLCAVGLLLHDPKLGRERLRLAIAALLVAYASAVRMNGVFSVLPLAAWVVVRAGRAWDLRWRRSAKLAVGVAAILAIAASGRVVNSALARNSVYAPAVDIEVFDLVAISTRTGQNLIPPSLRHGYDTPARIASLYDAFTCMTAYYGWAPGGRVVERRIADADTDETRADLAHAWWQAIRANPGAYLAHRVAAFAAALGWSDLPVHYPFERGIAGNYLGIQWHPSWLSDHVYAILDASFDEQSWPWRAWLYVWLTLVLLAVAVVARRRLPTARSVLVLASGPLYTLTYLVATPAADLRYQHWAIASTFLGGLILIHDLSPWPWPRARTARALAAIVAATVFVAYLSRNSHLDFGPAAPIPTRAAVANAEGLEHLGRGDWTGARSYFIDAIDHAPTWWIPETNLALATAHAGDPVAARAHHDRAVALDLTDAGARPFRASFLLEQGQAAGALADYARANIEHTTDYPLCIRAAGAAITTGDMAKAAAYSARCLSLDPDRFAHDIIPLANTFFTTDARAAQGIDYFQRLTPAAPQAWWIHANLGLLAARLGQTDLAAREQALGEQLKH